MMETLQNPTETKAIKEHRCSFCNDKIRVGEIYMKSTHVYDGTLYDWKSHKYCSKLATDLNMYEDADEGVTSDMFMESISEFYSDLMIKLLPQDNLMPYSDIITQLRYVNFRDKLMYVLRHFGKINSPTAQSEPPQV